MAVFGSAGATRRRSPLPAWLADGKRLAISNAPTAFGAVGFSIVSHVKSGGAEIEVDLPKSSAKRTLLRLRLPGGAKVISARAADKDLPIAGGNTIELTGLTGHVSVHAKVSH